MVQISRSEYAALYGPTVGDQVRLGDTDLWIEVEQDLTAGGEEAVFGGGKSIRESMAQGSTTRADGAPDTVITNAIVLDHWGIVRADVGIRDGRIVALGRAGQPRRGRRRAPAAADRAVHRRHLRRGQDPHRGRHRQPRASDLAVADRRGPRHRADHARRRRHRAVGGHQGHHGDARRLAPGEDPPLHRPVPDQPAAARQGQHRLDGRAQGAGAGRRRRLQGARGLGLHPGRDRRRPARRRRVGPAGRAALRLAERGRLRRLHDRRHRRPVDQRVPRRGRRRRALAGHPDPGRPAERHPRLDEPDAAAHRQHGRRTPGHADGLPPPEPRRARGSRVRRVPDPGDHHRRRGHPARHGRRSR